MDWKVLDLSHFLSLSLTIYPPTNLSSMYLSIYRSIDLSIYLSIYLSSYLPTYRFPIFETSAMFEHKNVQNGTILRGVFIFELDNIRNEAILRDVLTFRSARHQKRRILRDFLPGWKVECGADRLVPMRFAIFPVHLSKVPRLPRKINARSYEVLHPSRKIILANLHIWYSKMQPLSGNQRPDLLTSLMNMSFMLRLPRKRIFADPLQMSHACHHSWKCYKTLTFWSLLTSCTIPCARHLNLQKWSVHGVFCTFWLGNVLRATAACTFSTSQLPKVVRTWCVLCILTSECASRHNGVQFFNISTSKSGPKLVCFVHFDLEMCFAPQRPAIFHLSSGQLSPHPPL